MRQLVMGKSQSDICREYGYDPGNLSKVINAPLFQIELRAMENSLDGEALKIQSSIIKAAKDGIDLHHRVITNQMVDEVLGLPISLPVNIRQRSATDILVLASKVVKAMTPSDGDGKNGHGTDKPYERRLREITFREVTTTDIPIRDAEDAELNELLNQEDLAIPVGQLPITELDDGDGLDELEVCGAT